jgi:hypothetical protein
MNNNDARAVVEMVKAHVDRHQPAAFRLTVLTEGARQDEGWWYIVVRPDRSGVRSYDYSEALSLVEEEIRDEENVNVLLVPSLG